MAELKRFTEYSMKGSENDGYYLKPGISMEEAIHRLGILESKIADGKLVEVVYAHWDALGTKESDGWETYICSVCERPVSDNETNYCPHCGAKMDGERRCE